MPVEEEDDEVELLRFLRIFFTPFSTLLKKSNRELNTYQN